MKKKFFILILLIFGVCLKLYADNQANYYVKINNKYYGPADNFKLLRWHLEKRIKLDDIAVDINTKQKFYVRDLIAASGNDNTPITITSTAAKQPQTQQTDISNNRQSNQENTLYKSQSKPAATATTKPPIMYNIDNKKNYAQYYSSASITEKQNDNSISKQQNYQPPEQMSYKPQYQPQSQAQSNFNEVAQANNNQTIPPKQQKKIIDTPNYSNNNQYIEPKNLDARQSKKKLDSNDFNAVNAADKTEIFQSTDNNTKNHWADIIQKSLIILNLGIHNFRLKNANKSSNSNSFLALSLDMPAKKKISPKLSLIQNFKKNELSATEFDLSFDIKKQFNSLIYYLGLTTGITQVNYKTFDKLTGLYGLETGLKFNFSTDFFFDLNGAFKKSTQKIELIENNKYINIDAGGYYFSAGLGYNL